jgi:hypothetical protein
LSRTEPFTPCVRLAASYAKPPDPLWPWRRSSAPLPSALTITGCRRRSFSSPRTSLSSYTSTWARPSLQVEEEKTYEAGRTERFELRVGRDVRDLVPTAAEGAKPVFSDTVGQAQPFLMTMVRGAAQIEMAAAEFDEYTAHEGIPFRAKRAKERERYWRFLKLLGRAGTETETDLHHRFTGGQFEIVLLQNPFTAHPGDEQIVQLLFETKPLTGAAVAALHRAGDGTLTRLDGVTDARGVARFTLPVAGMWLIRSVHMRPCKGCKDVDWESFWSAYTFELAAN